MFALTPLEIEISGKQKPKEKVISTKSEFRNVPGEQGLAKKISGEQKDPIPPKPSVSRNTRNKNSKKLVLNLRNYSESWKTSSEWPPSMDGPRPRKVDLTCQVFQERMNLCIATKTGPLLTFRRSRYSFTEIRKKVRKKQKRLRPGRPQETRGCRQDAAHPRWHGFMTARKAPRQRRDGGCGGEQFRANTPTMKYFGENVPKEKVISTKSEFRNVPGEQGLAKKISGEQKDPIPPKPSVSRNTRNKNSKKLVLNLRKL